VILPAVHRQRLTVGRENNRWDDLLVPRPGGAYRSRGGSGVDRRAQQDEFLTGCHVPESDAVVAVPEPCGRDQCPAVAGERDGHGPELPFLPETELAQLPAGGDVPELDDCLGRGGQHLTVRGE